MGFLSFIGGCIGAACSVCSTIGGAIMAGVGSLIPAIGVITTAINLISLLAKLFAGKPEEEQPEEIGMKAEISAQEGIKPENFDSVNEYIEYLRKEIELEPDKLANLSEEDRRTYKLVGSGLYLKDVQEQIGVNIGEGFLKTADQLLKNGYKLEDVGNFVKEMKANNISNLDLCENYFDGTLQAGSKERIGINSSVYSMVEKHFSESNNIDVDEKVDSLKASIKNDK